MSVPCSVCGRDDVPVRARTPVGTDSKGERFAATAIDVWCCQGCAQWAVAKLGLSYEFEPGDERPPERTEKGV